MAKPKGDFVVPLEELLEAGSHFGHQKRRWNPKMDEYLYTVRDGVHIFDLAKTAEGLGKAVEYVKELMAEGGTIIFLGTKRQAQAIVNEEAKKAGVFYVTERWLGGTITNWEQISKRIKLLEKMKEKREKGEYDKYTKKENVLIGREIAKLERFLGGLSGLKKIPDALFVVDTVREIAAVKEAKMSGVKVVGMVDSNADPALVDYVIPANDDAVRSIKLVVSTIAEAAAEGMGLKGKKKVPAKKAKAKKTAKKSKK